MPDALLAVVGDDIAGAGKRPFLQESARNVESNWLVHGRSFSGFTYEPKVKPLHQLEFCSHQYALVRDCDGFERSLPVRRIGECIDSLEQILPTADAADISPEADARRVLAVCVSLKKVVRRDGTRRSFNIL